jgi:hypothetical protein
MTAKDGDREWILKAARGDITSDLAYEAVQLMRLRTQLHTEDPELFVELTRGDLAHPDDPRRRFDGLAPWERQYQIDPATNELLEIPAGPFIDWPEFWAHDSHDEEWLVDGVFALARGHAVYAQHKQGKSLFTLWCAAQLAIERTDVDVVYLDYEMTRDDIRERLEDMGHGPHSDLTRLHYWLLPNLLPLDRLDGANELLDIIDHIQTPERRMFVVIDTTGRAVEGEENSNDTIRSFYRWTGSALKKREITWVRLDHAGKDPTKGQRGGSAKGDDVDVVWRLQQADNGMTLWRDAARMSWIDEKLTFAIDTDPLRYRRTGELWPAGTKTVAEDLDRLEVPLDWGRPKAAKALKDAGVKARCTVISAALRFRRESAPMTIETSERGVPSFLGTGPDEPNGNSLGNTPTHNPLTSGNSSGNKWEQVDRGESGTGRVPLREHGLGPPDPKPAQTNGNQPPTRPEDTWF